MDWSAVIVAVGLCVAMAGAESVLTSRDLPTWLNSLKHPRLYAVLTYVLQGVIAYRLFAETRDALDIAALAALVVMMAANVAYNVVLDRTRNPVWAYRGVLWFLPLLALLQALLVLADPMSASLNLAYVAWVVGYDLPIMRSLWVLNS
jgi:tryptophan-rich sensory protein